MKKALFVTILVFILSVLPMLVKDASAQPPPPDPEPIPIDGGLFLLIAAGATYGARKLYKQQKDIQD